MITSPYQRCGVSTTGGVINSSAGAGTTAHTIIMVNDDDDGGAMGDYSSPSSSLLLSPLNSNNCSSNSISNSNTNNQAITTATTTMTSTTTTTTDAVTAPQAFLHLLKGYVGPGCLSLPWAVSQLGILPGCMAVCVMAVWSSYNCWTVVRLKKELMQQQQQQQQQEQQQQQQQQDASTTMMIHARSTERCITYPMLSRWLYGERMERYTVWCVCVQQLAICTVFLSFVGTNLQAVLSALLILLLKTTTTTTTDLVVVSRAAVVSAVALPVCTAMVLCFTDLKALAPMTAIGTALLMAGLGLLFTVIWLEWDERADADADAASTAAAAAIQWSAATAPLALCAILYSFEGICLVLPVEGSMQRPGRFGATFVAAMVAASCIFCTVAGLSVMAFGPVTNGSVTAFLLEKYAHGNSNATNNPRLLEALLLLANASVSMSVLVTYPLQLFPCIELLGPLLTPNTRVGTPDREQELEPTSLLSRRISASDHGNFTSCPDDDDDDDDDDERYDQDLELADDCGPGDDSALARVFLVLITYVAAVAIPNVECLISLAGALAGSSTALLIPPSLQIAYSRRQGTIEGVAVSYALFAGGLVFMLIGTVSSLIDIVKIYSGNDS